MYQDGSQSQSFSTQILRCNSTIIVQFLCPKPLTRIAFPINIPEYHWLAAAVDLGLKKVYIMDSLLSGKAVEKPRQEFANTILQENLMIAVM